jgi:hypothetical protein
MHRSFTAGIFIVGSLLAACAHDTSNAAGTTTVTSATPSGVRVTNVRPQDDRPAMQLADELCSRETACNHVGDGGRWRSQEACMQDMTLRVRAELSNWTCAPSATQEHFEECLAAVRSERCQTSLERVDRLEACQNHTICGP